ncbi:MAG: FAD-dependent oxidoreductase [Chloroflexota bacterium]|nr:FAD-dependent oxidoreductase [Chloroflexota bacterium]
MNLDFVAEEPARPEVYDVIIIGGGPAGGSAAIYTARADLETPVIDKGLTAGALGMASRIANYPGLPEPVAGSELVRRMRDQARMFGATFVNEKVLRVDLKSDPKQVWTGEGGHKGRAVIIATGAMGRTRRFPGEERLLGRGVSYCATCDGAFFRNQEVAVAGSNDEAVEEALTLTRFASQVHFLTPTRDVQAREELLEELKAHDKVTIHPSTRIKEITGQNQVEAVHIVERGEEECLEVDGVFVYLQGNLPITDFLDGQVPTNEEGCVVVGESFRTSVEGVFAVGDVLCTHVKQAVIAAAEGVEVAIAVDRHLHGREELRPDWTH